MAKIADSPFIQAVVVVAVISVISYFLYDFFSIESNSRKEILKYLQTHSQFEFCGETSIDMKRIADRIQSWESEKSGLSEGEREKRERNLKIYTIIKDFVDAENLLVFNNRISQCVLLPDKEFKQVIFETTNISVRDRWDGKYRNIYAFFRSEKHDLPAFRLVPIGENNASDTGKGVVFETHPEFSKNYYLDAPEEKGIEDFFNPTLLKFLEASKYFSLESDGRQIKVTLWYKEWTESLRADGATLKPKYWGDYMDTIDRMFAIFRENLSSTASSPPNPDNPVEEEESPGELQ